MTRLRKMMLEELQRRNYSEITTRKYLQYVTCNSPNRCSRHEKDSFPFGGSSSVWLAG